MKNIQKTWPLLIRNIALKRIIRDTLMLAVIGLLASFAILYSGRITFDRLVFSSGLNYSASTNNETPGGLHFYQSEDYLAGSAHKENSVVDLTQQSSTTWFYNQSDKEGVSRLLSKLIVVGKFSENDVLLDEATAFRLRVSIGDELTLASGSSGSKNVVKISGIIRPFHTDHDYGNGGLIVVSKKTIEDPCANCTTRTYFFTTNPPGSQGKWANFFSVLHEENTLGVLTIGLLIISFSIWIIGTIRIVADIRDQLQPTSDLLIILGMPTSEIKCFFLCLITLLSLLSSLTSALLAREAMVLMSGFYITVPQTISSAFILTIAAGIIAFSTPTAINTNNILHRK